MLSVDLTEPDIIELLTQLGEDGIEALPDEQKRELYARLVEYEYQKAHNRILSYYPEEGRYSRDKYPKHIETFEAGKKHTVRSVIAANRVGKTEGIGLYELVVHVTGRYPEWWPGHRYSHPINAWVAGETLTTTRDILQLKLLGKITDMGTGMLPGDTIIGTTRQAGVGDTIDTVSVRHISGGTSTITFKAYQQGVQTFAGSEIHFVLLDEECPVDIFEESITRTVTVKGGRVLLTFTPLKGLTELILHFRKMEVWEIGISWDDVPHITPEVRAQYLRTVRSHMIDARTKGIPLLGEGAVFSTITEEMIRVKPFAIPRWWKRIIGLDFGINHPQAATDCAFDVDQQVFYVLRCWRASDVTPAAASLIIKPWGSWVPVAWPKDGLQRDKGSAIPLKNQYKSHGLNMLPEPASIPPAGDSFEASLEEMREWMEAGRFKVFTTAELWWEEFRGYHRVKGLVVKERDDVLSSSRYAHMMRRYAKAPPSSQLPQTARRVGDRVAGY